MKKRSSGNKLFKIGLIVLIAIVISVGVIQLFLSFYLDHYVENRLKSLITEQTQGQYRLNFSALDLHVWGREFQIDKLTLKPADSSSTAPEIVLEQLSISGIQFLPYIFGGKIHTDNIRLSDPVVTFTKNSPDTLTFLKSSNQSSLNSGVPDIEIGRFEITDASFTILSEMQSDSLGRLQNFNLEITDIQLDSESIQQIPYFTYKDLHTWSENFRYQLSDFYALESGGIHLTTSGESLLVDSLKLVPQYPKYEFAKRKGHQLDRISLSVGQLLFEGADFEQWMAGSIQSKKFSINQANLEVFHSKFLPSGPVRKKTLPHIAFKNLPIPITIDTISISQSNISYSEHLPDVSRPGIVTFENIHGTITDITNDSAAISREHTIALDVSSEVMGKTTLSANFEFPMHLDGSHTARGTLESMEAIELNAILEPVGLVRAQRGTLHSMQFFMDLKEDQSDGWVQLIYSDLKINVLDADNVDDGGKKRLTSWLANVLKVKNNNNKEPYRRGQVQLERSEYKSMFSYWWKSLSTGLKDNVGI